MLTEFEVRRRLEAIEGSGAPPMRKARLILRLGRLLKSQARTIVHARDASADAQNRNTAALLDRLSSSRRML